MNLGRRSCLTLVWLGMLALTGIFAVLTYGSIRYNGLDGLYQRVRYEVITQVDSRRPRPEFVPTPLPIATVNADAFAEQLGAEQPQGEPTPTSTTVVGNAASAANGNNTAPSETQSNLPYQPAQPAVEMTGYRHMWQTWNNCGPATLATNLSFFDHYVEQAEVASVLKPNPDDKNVNPDEMIAYARAQGFQARVFVNGNFERLRLLLSNGVPVLIETWLEREPGDGLGHYRLLVGYDDSTQEWIASDSYVNAEVRNGKYAGIRVPYAKMDRDWGVFNRLHVVIYPDSLAPVVQAIIGQDMSQSTMWQNALSRFQNEIRANPEDPYAWFNLGTTLNTMGQYDQAAIAFDQARTLGLPWRMLWYQFGPFQAYYETGRYEELVGLAEATIEAGGRIEEVYYWKGRGLAALNDVGGAQEAWQSALTLNPGYTEAAVALADVQ